MGKVHAFAKFMNIRYYPCLPPLLIIIITIFFDSISINICLVILICPSLGPDERTRRGSEEQSTEQGTAENLSLFFFFFCLLFLLVHFGAQICDAGHTNALFYTAVPV